MKKRKLKILFTVIGILFLAGSCQEKAKQNWFRSLNTPSQQLTSEQIDSITRSARDLPVREKCSLLLDAEMRYLRTEWTKQEKRLKDILAYAPDDMRPRVKLQLFDVYITGICNSAMGYSAQDSAALLLLEIEQEKHLTVEDQSYFLYNKAAFFGASGGLDEALSFALQGLDLQRELGNKEEEQSFLLFLTILQVRARNYEACSYYCQRLLADSPRLPDHYTLQTLIILTIAYNELGKWDEAIETGLKAKEMGKILDSRNGKIIQKKGIDRLITEIYINKGDGAEARRWLNATRRSKNMIYHSFIAQSYDCEGKADSAARAREQLFRKLKEDDDHLGIVRSNMSPFIPHYLAYANWLWDKQRRTEALELLSQAVKIPENNSLISDSGSTRLALLEQYYTYCVALNRREEATAGLIRLNDFRKRLSESQKASRAKESAERAFAKELVSQINRQKQAIRVRERWGWTAGIATVVLAILSVGGWIMYRQKKKTLDAIYLKQKKIEQISHQINTLQDTSEQEEHSREERLFHKMDRSLRKEQLFVNPNLTLDDVALLIGTNRSYASAAVNVCTGMNFSQWMQKLRVEYFISQLKGNENRVEELFLKSGFSSSSSFYRNFKNHTGLTPKQYIEREKKNLSSPRR